MNSMTTKASNSAKKTTGKADILSTSKSSSANNQMAGSNGTTSLGAGVDGGSNPYDLLRERGIPTTLSDAEINGAKTVDLRMQGQGGSKAKTGPKPAGTGPHNKKIAETADLVTDGEIIAGGGMLPEKAINTPGF